MYGKEETGYNVMAERDQPCVARDVPAVQQAMNDLNATIGWLDSQVQRAEERLNAVLGPDVPNAQVVDNRKELSSSVPLAQFIEKSKSHLAHLTGRLERILNRVEI